MLESEGGAREDTVTPSARLLSLGSVCVSGEGEGKRGCATI